MALPSPDSARGWLATLYPLMERGGGVLALAQQVEALTARVADLEAALA